MAKLNRSDDSTNKGPGRIDINQGDFRSQQDVLGDSLLQLGGRGEVAPGAGTVNDPLNAPFVLYVNPYIGKDDFVFGSYATDSTDPLRRIESQRLVCGYTEAAPFATLNRAVIEAGIITSKDYLSSTPQALQRVCIVLAPGTYDLLCDAGVAASSVGAFVPGTTTVDAAYLRGFNPETVGGIILPRGCSVVSLDLRKTILRPEPNAVPSSDQDESATNRRAILRATGEGYYYGITFMDADPSTAANKRSHHLLSCFEFATKAQVDDFYTKITNAFSTPDANLTTAAANSTEYVIVAEQTSSATAGVDSTASASPYIYNCSIRSQYGLCGIYADGANRTGFRSMVVAQFTGVSLQNDYRCWQQYNGGSWGSVSDFSAYSGADPDNIRMNPDRRSFHVRAVNRAVIQEVSVFAIGQGVHHWTQTGGELTITNSNSNFGGCAGLSEGYQATASTQDMDFTATHQRVPSDLTEETNNIRKIYIGTINASQSDAASTLSLTSDVSGLGDYTLVPGSYVWIESPTTADYRQTLGSQVNANEIVATAAFTTDTADGGNSPGDPIGTTGLTYPSLANRRVYIRRLVDTRSAEERRYALLVNPTANARVPQRDYILRDESSGVGTSVDVAVLRAGTTSLSNDSTTKRTEVELKQINPATTIRPSGEVYRPGDALSDNGKHYICNKQVVSTGTASVSFLADNFEENYVHMQEAYNPEDFFKNTQPVLVFDHDSDQAESSTTLGWVLSAGDANNVWTDTAAKNVAVQGQFKTATDYRGLARWCSQKPGIGLALPQTKAARDVVFASSVADQEFRRPSVIRMYGHAYEWAGFGNYSKGLPQYQGGMLASNKFTYYGTNELGGRVYFTGFNEEGFSVSPRGVEDIQTGEVLSAEEINAPDADILIPGFFEALTIGELTVTQDIEINGTVSGNPVWGDTLPVSTTGDEPASRGIISTASIAEAAAGTNDTKAVTPAGLAGAVGSGVVLASPSGVIQYFCGTTAPAGWLICNGDEIPNGTGTVQSKNEDFSNLFAALGTTFGVNGANRKLPNLQGTFVRGWTAAPGATYDQTINGGLPGTDWNPDPSRTFGALQGQAVEAHGHDITEPNAGQGHQHTVATEVYAVSIADDGPDVANGTQAGSVDTGFAKSGIGIADDASVTGAVTDANESRPTNIALLPIIKI